MVIIYFKGFRVKLTGKTETVYGGHFAEFIYQEGPKTGEKGLMSIEIVNRQTKGV
jgi:hypothetical protein